MTDARDAAPHRVAILGAGFAGLEAARVLANRAGVVVTLVDRTNHHLFQPLLYQVATAGLSPADIAAPIRALLRHARNVTVLMATAEAVQPERRRVLTSAGPLEYDTLLVACGAQHSYFGNERWEPAAPGLKTLAQAVEIRKRVLAAFEAAEQLDDQAVQQGWLSFFVVGGGPTGVELAGAIGEMSRWTLACDFRRIDPRRARIVLVEAGPRILTGFDEKLAARAVRDLQSLGVQVWTDARVTAVDREGLVIGGERHAARTVIWAAGVRASPIGATLGVEVDRAGRVPVRPDLTLAGRPEILVLGDLANCPDPATGRPLPGVGAVAKQQGEHAGRTVLARLAGRPHEPFRYHDRGNMATVGRARAIAQLGKRQVVGRPAWWLWLVVHVYYLSGFRRRLSVLLQWAWSYFTFGRGARLIIEEEWRAYPDAAERRAEHREGDGLPAPGEPAPAARDAPRRHDRRAETPRAH